MKKIPLVLFILFITVHVKAQVMWQIKSDTSYKWFYQDGDEFNDDRLNELKWQSGTPWSNFVLAQDLYFARENTVMQNGSAVFLAKKETRRFAIRPDEAEPVVLKKTGKTIENNTCEVNYTAGLITSQRSYRYGYFEIRFKSNAEKGIWPAFWLYSGSPGEEIDFFELKGEKQNQLHVDVHCPLGCDEFRGGFLNLKKNWGAWVTTKESLANEWNIVSGEWQPGYVTFFLNGQPIGYFAGDFKTPKKLLINTSVASEKAFKPGPDATTKWPNAFTVDYVRVWSKEDTVSMKDNYKYFEYTPKTIDNRELYNAEVKKKVKFIYNDRVLNKELGTITLLPVFYNKYSLSIQGKNLTDLKIDILDRFGVKAAGFNLENVNYYILDLSELPTGPYKIKIHVMGQTLSQDIPVINPNKIGEY